MTTECTATIDVARRPTARRAATISPTEWGLLAILVVGFLLMLPGAAFLISQLAA